MKYVIMLAILVMACENQQAGFRYDEDELGADEPAISDEAEDGYDDLLGEVNDLPDAETEPPIPNTLPDSTVPTCGNGQLDEGEECDESTVEEFGGTLDIDCADLDPEIYEQGVTRTLCDDKWCVWYRANCYSAEKKFECPQGYVGQDCGKCASLYQDTDNSGTCEFACGRNGLGFFTGDDPTADMIVCGIHSASDGYGCEYLDGIAICSCQEGWERQPTGSCDVFANAL